MKNIFLKLLIAWALIVAGYLIGGYLPAKNSQIKREVLLGNAFVFDSLFCKTGQGNELLIRIALLDFISSGGISPPKDAASALLLSHLQRRTSPEEIESYFESEFSKVDLIHQENFLVKEKDKPILMIAGRSPFLERDCLGQSNCRDILEFIEELFIDYVMTY